MNMTGLYCSLRKQMTFNLLGPDIHREIILTDLPYIFIVLGEFVRRSKQFPFGDHFINSYNLNSCSYYYWYCEEKFDFGYSWDLKG